MKKMLINSIQRIWLKKYKAYLKLDKKKIIIKSIAISSILNLVLLLSFKKIRSYVPPPEIGKDGLVGFSQYFGYPFYFDTAFFFFLIFVPMFIFIALYVFNKNK